MVRSSKRITRKDIRRPDQFVTLTGKILTIVAERRTEVLASAALIIAAVFVLLSWNLYQTRQNRLASQEYSKALALYHGGKHQEALDAFARVGLYRSTIYSRLGLLYQASSHIALNEKDKALAALQDLLQRETKDGFLRQLTFITMAQIEEEAGKCTQAATNFGEAEKLNGPFKEEALLGKARCKVQNNDLKKALNSYRQHRTDYPGSERATEVSLIIQGLEGKIAKATSK
jgi:predicted negative regulator of RcsB-dependent stress response